MDRAEATKVMREVEAAASAVFAAHNLAKARTTASYTDGTFRITLKATSTDPALDPKVTDWHKYAKLYGLPEDALGKTLTTMRGKYRIDGLVPSRRKYPVAVTALATGKAMLFTIASTKAALGLKVEPWEV